MAPADISAPPAPITAPYARALLSAAAKSFAFHIGERPAAPIRL